MKGHHSDAIWVTFLTAYGGPLPKTTFIKYALDANKDMISPKNCDAGTNKVVEKNFE